MKFDRLLSTLLLLQQRDVVPATEIAERLEVSIRTVYRDVEALSAAGIPVYAERGKYGGIRLLPGFRTDMTGMTVDEARALFVLVSQSAHSDLGLDRALGSALRKMMSALPEALRRFLLLLVDHAAVGKGMSFALESIIATDSLVFDDARTRMAHALAQLLDAGAAAGTVSGSTLLRALGGICGMRATEGWLDEAHQITALLLDGLRHGPRMAPDRR